MFEVITYQYIPHSHSKQAVLCAQFAALLSVVTVIIVWLLQNTLALHLD